MSPSFDEIESNPFRPTEDEERERAREEGRAIAHAALNDLRSILDKKKPTTTDVDAAQERFIICLQDLERRVQELAERIRAAIAGCNK